MVRSLLTRRLLALAALVAIPVAARAVEASPSPLAVAASGPAADGCADFGAGPWGVPDGGNQYLDRTTKPGVVQVTNLGPGRVAVHFIHPWGFHFVRHLQPGATLHQSIGKGWNIEVWDGGHDGLGANGSYSSP